MGDDTATAEVRVNLRYEGGEALRDYYVTVAAGAALNLVREQIEEDEKEGEVQIGCFQFFDVNDQVKLKKRDEATTRVENVWTTVNGKVYLTIRARPAPAPLDMTGEELELDSNLRHHVFICKHEKESKLAAELLKGELERLAGIRVWNSNSEDNVIEPTMMKAVEDSAAVLIILSRGIFTRHWCLKEIAHGIKHRKPFILVRTESFRLEDKERECLSTTEPKWFGIPDARVPKVFTPVGLSMVQGHNILYLTADAGMRKTLLEKILSRLSGAMADSRANRTAHLYTLLEQAGVVPGTFKEKLIDSLPKTSHLVAEDEVEDLVAATGALRIARTPSSPSPGDGSVDSCRAFTNAGKPCSRTAKYAGFCRLHRSQAEGPCNRSTTKGTPCRNNAATCPHH